MEEKACQKQCTPPGVSDKKLPKLRYPVIVEGRYDKCAVCSMFDANVITTDGFGVFSSSEKQALISRLSERGVIILTDSDGGGKQIRSFLRGLVRGDKIFNLYIPEIPGKERRKTSFSKAGLLGVEGVGGEILYKLLSPFATDAEELSSYEIKCGEFYSLGLTGGDNSSLLRDKLCERIGMPRGMSAKALMAAIPLIMPASEWEKLKEAVKLNI